MKRKTLQGISSETRGSFLQM